MNTYNFIEEYKIPLSICDKFIEYHNENTEYKHRGLSSFGYDPEIKESIDVDFYNHSNNKNIKNFFERLGKSVGHYTEKYNVHKVYTNPLHIIQHYKKGGGYKKYHYERASLETSKRQLAYTLYCNTLKKGGTHFLYQDKTIEAEKGKLAIWPSDFTHTHKSIVSDTEEKFIVTGWFEII